MKLCGGRGPAAKSLLAAALALLLPQAAWGLEALREASKGADHPPPGQGDYNPETEVVKLSVTAEACIAILWILMVCCMPLVAIKLEGRNVVTRSQMMIFGVMWTTFLVGVFLFTNVLYFQSVHFDGIRSLTLVECVYLFSQILTTVGYGDIVPAKPRAQVFVGMYVIFNLLIIAHVISDVSDIISRHSRAYYNRLVKAAASQLMIPGFSPDAVDDDEKPEAAKKQPSVVLGQVTAEIMRQQCPPLAWGQLAKFSLAFLMWCIIGVIFFTYYPGEERTVAVAVYMTIISLSTVGFGVYTPITEGGKVFAAFWLLFGSATLMAVVGSFTQLMDQMRTREKFVQQFSEKKMQQDTAQLADRVDLHDFIVFALRKSNVVRERTIQAIDATFTELGPDMQGFVPKQAVRDMLAHHRKQEMEVRLAGNYDSC